MMKTVAWAWGLLLASVLDASARDVSVPVSYEAPRDGYVSLALQAPSGVPETRPTGPPTEKATGAPTSGRVPASPPITTPS